MQNHTPDHGRGISRLLRDPDSRQAVLWWLFILLGVAAIYLPGLYSALIFDDERLRDTVFSGYASLQFKERMLSYGSFVWIQGLFGENWPLQRGTNILIHIGVLVFLYRFARLMMDQVDWPEPDALVAGSRDSAIDLPRSKDAATLFGVAVFALNPVAVYAVAYLIQRSILLATLFSTIFLYWVACAGASRGRKSIAWLLGALIAYLFALFSKEHVLMLPVAGMAVFIIVRRAEKAQVIKVLALAMLPLAVGIYFLAEQYGSLVGQVFDDASREYLSQLAILRPGIEAQAWPLSILNQTWLFLKYGVFWILPYPGWMSIDLRPTFPLTLLSFPHIIGALAYLAILLGSLGLMIKYSDWKRFLGLALFMPAVLFMTEFATVWIQDPFVLYRSYLWAIGVPLLTGFVWIGSSPKITRIALVVFGVVLAAVAIERAQTLRSAESAWADAVKKIDPAAPANAVGRWKPLVNYGNRLLQQEKFAQAAQFYAAAARTGEVTGIADYHLGLALLKLGKYPQALEALERAENLKIHSDRNPGLIPLYKGVILFYLGRYEQVVRVLDDALPVLVSKGSKLMAVEMKMALETRAKANIKLGRLQDAIADYTRMTEFLPTDPNSHIGLAMALKTAGQHQAALAILDRLMKEHDRPDILVGRIIILLDAKQIEAAKAALQAALSRYPSYPALRQLAQKMGL